MTVLVWDGKSFAADKQSTVGGQCNKVTKIFRLEDGIVGLMGDGPHARALLNWFKTARAPGEFPAKPADSEYSASAVMVTNDREIRVYSTTPHYEVIEDKRGAWGCGRDYALAAMHLGCDAQRAVEVAIELDLFCGVGIDVLTLEDA